MCELECPLHVLEETLQKQSWICESGVLGFKTIILGEVNKGVRVWEQRKKRGGQSTEP